MRKKKVCAVYGCTPALNSNVKYHSFPKQPNLAKIWLHKCCRKDRVNTETAVICHRHFSHSQKARNLKYELLGCATPSNFRDLKTNAVPDQELPGQSRASQDGGVSGSSFKGKKL